MFQQGFSIALSGLAAGAVFLIALVILVKLIALIFAGTAENTGEMGIPPGFLPEAAKAPGLHSALSTGAGRNVVDFKNIAVAIAAAKAHSDSNME